MEVVRNPSDRADERNTTASPSARGSNLAGDTIDVIRP
jgi:hypothetical protein